jgi:hypothetical protein
VINLAYLIHHYGDAYVISRWRGRVEARRRDDGTVLDADDAQELLVKIRADYAARPVPRRIEADRPETPGCRFLPKS